MKCNVFYFRVVEFEVVSASLCPLFPQDCAAWIHTGRAKMEECVSIQDACKLTVVILLQIQFYSIH